ncbi:hypothetical protein BH20ACT1_BH20ACT1_05110 [soil metagenome]
MADGIESMMDELVDVVVGPFGSPWCSERQAEVPGVHRLCQPPGLPPPGVPAQAPQGDHRRWHGRIPLPAAGVHRLWATPKASRLLGELAGVGISARTIRRPERLGPEITEVPILLLDGTVSDPGRPRAAWR